MDDIKFVKTSDESYCAFTREGSADFNLMPDRNKTVWFSRLFVRPDCRNTGVATRLMEVVVCKLDELGFDCVCGVNPYGDLNYEQLVCFYKKFGFEDYEEGMLLRKCLCKDE